ncbi:MAG: dihydroorotase [Pseudomonadota bacterium]
MARRQKHYVNARIIDPSAGYDGPGGLLVAGKKIVASGRAIDATLVDPDARVIDCRGRALMPGLVDARVFVGEPGAEHRETIASVSEAAAAGGVTSLIMMPHTDPVIDDMALVEFVQRTARGKAAVNIYPAAALTRDLADKEMAEIGLLKQAGAVAFSNGHHSMTSSLLMRRLMTYAKDFDATLMCLASDRDLVASGVMNEGATATMLGLPGIPKEAEIIPLERDIRLVGLTGADYHAVTISTAESAEIVRQAKANGLPVTASVSINHLSLNENDIGPYRTFFRMAPPLRTEEDRMAMVEAVADGTVDIIVSNHDPQDVDTKRFPFANAADGAIGLETLLSAALRLHHGEQIPLLRLIESMTSGPASIFDLPGGTLSAGAQADFILVDLDEPWVLTEEDIRSRSKNTPFEQARFQGRVLKTYVAGKCVFDQNSNND